MSGNLIVRYVEIKGSFYIGEHNLKGASYLGFVLRWRFFLVAFMFTRRRRLHRRHRQHLRRQNLRREPPELEPEAGVGAGRGMPGVRVP